MKTAIDLGLITASQVIDELGGTMKVSEMLGIKPPSVSDWKSSGVIPHDKLLRICVDLESRTDGRLGRRFLFPDDWQKIWPELAEKYREIA